MKFPRLSCNYKTESLLTEHVRYSYSILDSYTIVICYIWIGVSVRLILAPGPYVLMPLV